MFAHFRALMDAFYRDSERELLQVQQKVSELTEAKTEDAETELNKCLSRQEELGAGVRLAKEQMDVYERWVNAPLKDFDELAPN